MKKREAVESLFSLARGGIASCVGGDWTVEEGVTEWKWGASACVVRTPTDHRALAVALRDIGVPLQLRLKARARFAEEYINDICAEPK